MRVFAVVCITFVHVLLLATPVHSSPQDGTVIGAVVFEGVTVFNPDHLAPVYQGTIGKRLSPQTRDSLASRVRELYQDNGFYQPSVAVVPHRSVVGVVVVRVQEPQLATIDAEGVSLAEARRLERAFQPLQAIKPLSRRYVDHVAQQYEAANEVSLETRLQPVGSRADSNGRYTLKVRKRTHWLGALTYSTEGDRRLGRELVIGQVAVANPVPLVRQARIFGLHTAESDAYRVFGGGVVTAPDVHNRVTLETRVGRAVLDNDPSPGQTVFRFREHELEWGHSLDTAAQTDTEVFAGVIARGYTRTDRGVREVDEALRMADVGFTTLNQATRSAHRLAVSGRVGVDALGASRDGTQAGDLVDLSFRIARAEYTYWSTLPLGLTYRVLLEGQYSAENLPSSQRFVIGGSQFARAYEPGAFSGDRGAGAELELRRRVASPWGLPAELTPFVYYGLAMAYQNDSRSRDSAAAAGLGVRFQADPLSGYLEFGRPLTTDSDLSDDDGRLTGRLTVSF